MARQKKAVKDEEETTSRRARKEKVNHITVKVARTGQSVKEVALNGDRTVEDALTAADVEFSARDRVRVNGETASLDDVLEQDDIVTVSGKIKGGR